MSKLNASNNVLAKPTEISNELNTYFTNFGENFINNLTFNHALNMTDFQKYFDKALKK